MSVGLSFALILSLAAGTALAQATQPSETDTSAQAALAERIARVAKNALAQRKLLPVVMRQSAALLDAAVKEDPTNPRWLQLVVEARLQLGTPSDIDAAIDALRAYLALNRDDRVAQAKLIDLLVRRMQSSDEQLRYLQDKLQTTAISEEVRAHIAASAARICFERGQLDRADAMIAEALKLNPLCGVARRMQYQRLLESGADATARLSCLLSMVRANPAQPTVMASVASVLADVGLVDQSGNWYTSSFDVSRRLGLGTNEADYTRYAQVLFVAGQVHDSDFAADKLLGANPGNIDASFIKLLVARREGNKEAIEFARTSVATALGRRLGELHARLD
ncbi:MAG: tetratricopeptide repeat protein, partial [Tepidisphaeraceae bacterium]